MSTPKSILVIDDNNEMLETISMMLRHMGTRDVMTATSVTKAIQALDASEGKVDLIICDWNMPERTGIDFLAKLRHEGNLTPFIMVTARNDTASVLEASQKGVDLYICKPFSLEELKRKINWVSDAPRRVIENITFSDQ